MRIDVPRAIVMYLLWLGLISGSLIVAMSDALPVKVGFLHPDNVFTLLIEAELFFVLVIWPFFVPKLLKPVTIDTAKTNESHLLVLQVLVLFIVGLPVALLCTSLSDVGAVPFLAGHLLVAAAASFVAALHDLAIERKFAFAPVYFAVAFAIAGLAPFVDFLRWGREGGSGMPGLLTWVSPFWTASRLEGSAPIVMAAVLGAVAVSAMVAAPFARKRA